MQLYIALRYGDFVATKYAPFGANIARVAGSVRGFDPDEIKDDTEERWISLDQKMIDGCASICMEPTESVGELESAAFDVFRQRGDLDSRHLYGSILNSEPRVWLADAVTGQPLDSRSTIASCDLSDGDVLTLCVEVDLSVNYYLLPAPRPEDVFARLQVLSSVQTDDLEPRLSGILLYTDSDEELAQFVRTSFGELNALSGSELQIVVMEKPASWSTAKRYWKPRLDPQLYRTLSLLRWLFWLPYDRSSIYDVARSLDVPVDELPCLVLVDNVSGPDRLIFPVRDASIAYIRSLFRELADVVRGSDRPKLGLAELTDQSRYGHYFPEDDSEPGGDEPVAAVERLANSGDVENQVAFARLRAAKERIRAELQRVAVSRQDYATYEFKGSYIVFQREGAAMNENFNFFGQTTFVNRPVDTVVNAFAGAHGANIAGDRLTELLRLFLSSNNLNEQEKEEAGHLVQQVAEESEAGRTKGGRFEAAIEQLKRIAVGAADIAKPALEVANQVLSLGAGVN